MNLLGKSMGNFDLWVYMCKVELELRGESKDEVEMRFWRDCRN
jgi:hypothetical protein